MKDIIKKSLIYGGISVGALGAGAGVATGIILPKALQAKDALGAFVSSGGSSANLQKALKEKGKLKVVALGDSITAGRNPYLGNEYYSYADFLVHGLRTSLDPKYKVEYRNYAKSGLKLAEYKSALENPNVARQLHDADIIPLTFGANDVLAVLEMFGLPYNIVQTILGNAENILKSVNPLTGKFLDSAQGTWDKFDWGLFTGSKPINNKVRDANSNLTFSKQDAKDMLNNSINTMIDISNGKSGQFFGLDKKFKDKIFDLVKREFATMVRDLHEAAPNAQIVILGPALPFAQFPAEILFEKNKKMHNNNLLQLFNRLLESMRDGAKTSLGKDNGFVDFYKMDELKDLAPYSWNLDNLDTKYDIYVKYKADKTNLIAQLQKATKIKAVDLNKKLIKLEKDFLKATVNEDSNKEPVFKNVTYDSVNNYVNTVKNQPLSNIMDIHPTTYGQSLIGKSLFDIFAKRLGLEKTKIMKGNNAIKAVPNDSVNNPKFEKADQDDNVIKGGAGNTRYKAASKFNTLLTSWSQIPDGVLQQFRDALDGVKLTNDNKVNQKAISDSLTNFIGSLAEKLSGGTISKDMFAVFLNSGLTEFNKIDMSKLLNGLNDLKKISSLYILGKTKLNTQNVDDLTSTKWSIYSISAFFGAAQSLSHSLLEAQKLLATNSN